MLDWRVPVGWKWKWINLAAVLDLAINAHDTASYNCLVRPTSWHLLLLHVVRLYMPCPQSSTHVIFKHSTVA